jgi:SAM-dependent methyltransferase
MIDASNCVICESPIRRLHKAMVAPFLARRIWDRTPFTVDLVRCDACGFLFYNPRLDDAEAQRLYNNYRSEEYQRMRQSSEPWYTVTFNAALASPESYVHRRGKLAELLLQHLGHRPVRRILDFGGDRGDLVAGLIPGAEAYVYDISGIPAVDGVTATSTPAACQADLVINSNVLEHVGFPRRLVAQILEAAPAGGLVFLEVPCEKPLGWPRMVRRLAQVGIVCLTRPGLGLSLVRPASLYMMHEHINYYTEQSLAALMRASGCKVVAAGAYYLEGRAGKGDMAWCLGTKP